MNQKKILAMEVLSDVESEYSEVMNSKDSHCDEMQEEQEVYNETKKWVNMKKKVSKEIKKKVKSNSLREERNENDKDEEEESETAEPEVKKIILL